MTEEKRKRRMNKKEKPIKTDSGKPEEIYQERGCGYKIIGGYYLFGEGIEIGCDALPIPLTPCGECRFKVGSSRGMMAIHMGYLLSKLKDHHFKRGVCICPPSCPICNLKHQKPRDTFFLMYVSSGSYTPESFVAEARKIGVSKRIAPHTLPKEFVLGESWVFLAHRKIKTPVKVDVDKEIDEEYPSIFYAFKPSKIQVILSKDTPEEKIQEYRDQGFTPVLVDSEDPRFRRKRRKRRERK